METLGLTAAQALTTFAAVGGVVTLLYLLRLRRVERRVAYVELWRRVLPSSQSSRLGGSLRRIGSWLLALGLVAALTLALADPRPTPGERTAWVLLVDTSLSMQATDVAPSRFERMRRSAHALVDGLGDGDVALVVSLGPRARGGQLTADPAELHRALDALGPTDAAADLSGAIGLALDATHDEHRTRIVLYSDGAGVLDAGTLERLSAAGAELLAAPIEGAAAPANVAITALAARPHPLDPSRAEVLLEVVSHAAEPVEAEVVLTTEGRAVEVVRLSLAPGARARRLFGDVSGLDRTLEAALRITEGPPDALAADDHAFARIARRSRARVGVVSRDNAFLEAALLLDEALEVTELPADETPDPARYDVVLFDGLLPPAPYAGPALYLRPDPRTGGAGPLEVTGDVERPRFDVLTDEHPLLRWVSLRNVNVSRALALSPSEVDVVVAGDEGAPLLVAGERELGAAPVPFVALAFDVRESDLPLRIAWPVLLLDAIRFLAPASASEPAFARAGEPFEEAVGSGDARLTPSGASSSVPIAVRDGRARLEIDRAGIHRLVVDGEEILLAVSPAAGPESELEAPHAVSIDGEVLPAPSLPARRGARQSWEWLALAALVLLLIEAATYHRRWTV